MPDLPARAADVAARPAPRRLALPTPRVALVLAAALVIGVVLYLARSALTPFIVGLLLIYLLDPAVGWVSRVRIGRFGMPRGLAVLIVYAITIVVVVVALRLLLEPLVSQLIAYVSDFPRLLSSLDSTIGQLRLWYLSIDLPDPVRQAIDEAIAGAAGAGVDLGALLPLARSILGTAAGFFGFLIIPIWAFYILRDRVHLTDAFANSLPASWRDEVWAVLSIIERVVGRWIRAQLLLGVIVGVATYLGLVLLGWTIDPQFIQFAVLLAVIAGIFELLPIIGPIISAVPTLVVALTTSDPLIAVVAVIVLYVVVQQVEGAVLVPRIQGSAVQLHPSLIIFALIIGGSIAGLLGAILAIPITAAGRDVYRYLFRRLSDDYPEATSEAAPTVPAGTPAVPASTPDDVSTPDDEATDTLPADSEAAKEDTPPSTERGDSA